MDGNKNSGAGGAVGEKGAKLCPEAQIRAGMTDNKQTSAAIGRMGGGKMGRVSTMKRCKYRGSQQGANLLVALKNGVGIC